MSVPFYLHLIQIHILSLPTPPTTLQKSHQLGMALLIFRPFESCSFFNSLRESVNDLRADAVSIMMLSVMHAIILWKEL